MLMARTMFALIWNGTFQFLPLQELIHIPGHSLQDGQERYQRDRDLALFITLALYALNIVDANVDAHLKQFNVDDDLGLDIKPYLEYNPIIGDPNYGVALTIKF